MIKFIGVLTVLLFAAGCAGNKAKSDAAFVGAVTANGCSIAEVDVTRTMGKIKIKCK